MSFQPGSYSTLGFGCAGSRIDPCIAANQNGPFFASRGIDNATYAIAAVAHDSTRITGFELHTSSRQSVPVTVPVSLYTSDDQGFPATRVRTGTMLVGENMSWYSASLDQPYDAQRGELVFLSFDNPSVSITMSTAIGPQTPASELSPRFHRTTECPQ